LILGQIASDIEKPSRVTVGCFIADNDSCYVARQLGAVFESLGWTFSLAMLPASADGILLETSRDDFPAAISLKRGLLAAGLPVAARTNPVIPAAEIHIIVGPKRN
jgi:hypothetical protein